MNYDSSKFSGEFELILFTPFQDEYGLDLPRMQRGEADILESSSYIVRNLEQLNELKVGEAGIILHNSIPIWNREAFYVFKNSLSREFCFVASYELTLHELSDLFGALDREDKSRMIFPLYGRIPLMVSGGCTRNTLTGCTKSGGWGEIVDRKNIVFPVEYDCSHCISVIYNSLPYSGHDLLNNKPTNDAAAFLLEFTTEGPGEVLEVLNYYTEAFSGAGKPPFLYTTGHLNRKVL